MNGRTNAKNGAGAIRNGCAVLEVRAPAYSQITATRSDGLTKRQSKGYVDLSNSNFWFYYIIIQKFELSNLIWTVSCTDGTGTDTANVTISENKWYDVKLSYKYYLFKSGVGGIIPLSSGHEGNSSISIGTSEISVNYTSTASYQIFCCNTNAIDLSDFSALCVKGLITERQTSSQYGGCVTVASSMMVVSDDSTSSKYIAKVPILTGPSTQTTVLDISSIDISGYVGIRGGMKGTISAIYLI